MKKLVILLAILCLCACNKQVKEEPKEELIQIYKEDGLSFYVATPSGTLYYATDSEPILYTNEEGETRNIYEGIE